MSVKRLATIGVIETELETVDAALLDAQADYGSKLAAANEAKQALDTLTTTQWELRWMLEQVNKFERKLKALTTNAAGTCFIVGTEHRGGLPYIKLECGKRMAWTDVRRVVRAMPRNGKQEWIRPPSFVSVQARACDFRKGRASSRYAVACCSQPQAEAVETLLDLAAPADE